MAVVDLCRITVRTHCPSATGAVDLTLPTRRELGEILPDIVELAGEKSEARGNGAAERWALSRLDGFPLHESMTLHENGVRDGDILLLTTDIRIPAPHFGDLTHYVVDASMSAERGGEWSRWMGAVACSWAAGCASAALAWSGHSAPSMRAIVAAVVAIAAWVAAIVASRVDAAPLPIMTLGSTAAVFGAVAGFLLVPGGPAPPNFFLAAAIFSAMSSVVLHATSGSTTFFVALTTFSATSAIVASFAAIWPAPTATVGSVLAAASLVMLSAAAKVAILLTGLSPRMPSAADPSSDETVVAEIGTARAEHGHRMLTGLLAGWSLAAALGVVLVAVGHHAENACSGVAFTGVVSAALILRAPQQRGLVRPTVVLGAGLISTTACFALAGLSAPELAIWTSLLAVAMGACALYCTHADIGSRLSPFTRRGLEMVDYTALAVVIPLACWVGGAFGFVRGLSLT